MTNDHFEILLHIGARCPYRGRGRRNAILQTVSIPHWAALAGVTTPAVWYCFSCIRGRKRLLSRGSGTLDKLARAVDLSPATLIDFIRALQ